MIATITTRTYTAKFHPDQPKVTVHQVTAPGIMTEEFTKLEKAERYATLLNTGHTYLEAINMAYNPNWKPDTSGPATDKQKALAAKLLATSDDQNLGSVALPPVAEMTKDQASWLIDRLK